MFDVTCLCIVHITSLDLSLQVKPQGMMGTIRGSAEECNLVGPALCGLYLILQIPTGTERLAQGWTGFLSPLLNS